MVVVIVGVVVVMVGVAMGVVMGVAMRVAVVWLVLGGHQNTTTSLPQFPRTRTALICGILLTALLPSHVEEVDRSVLFLIIK